MRRWRGGFLLTVPLPGRLLRARAGAAALLLALLVLAARRLSSRAVARIRQAAFANRLTLRRVCHGMVMVITGRLVRPPPSGLDGLFRRVGRDEAIAAVADEVG